MTRFVVDAGVALWLAEGRVVVPDQHRVLAPTLMRSEVLSRLYQAVQAGTLDRREADLRLDHLRGQKIRLLGDRVLQRRAWDVAAHLGWPETGMAEYVALTQLQGDVLLTQDAQVAAEVRGLVAVAGPEALTDG